MNAKKKVLVIGLDGATWDLLKPWADEGVLSTLQIPIHKRIYKLSINHNQVTCFNVFESNFTLAEDLQ